MPELPEVRAHAERMTAALAGDRLEAVRLLGFSSLKTVFPGPDAAVGSALTEVTSRGKHLLLDFGDTTHVVHLMQAGRLKPDAKEAAKPRGGLMRWRFAESGAWLLTEAGTERKAGIWVLQGDPRDQPPLDHLGPEADTVDAADLVGMFAEHSARLHTFLRDQRVIAGIGRMLANEICHRSRLSPFAQTRSLTADDADTVARGISDAITEALAVERQRSDMSSSADRPSRVHNRTGEDCPVCGDQVRSVEYNAYTVSYCPTCQTDGKVLADNAMSKFGVRDAAPKKKPKRSRR